MRSCTIPSTVSSGTRSPRTHVVQRGLQGGRTFAFRQALGRAENVAGGQMAGAQPLGQQLRLRSLADARRAQQHQPPDLSGAGAGGFEQTALPPLSQAVRSGFLVTSHTFAFTHINYDRRPHFSKRDARIDQEMFLHCQDLGKSLAVLPLAGKSLQNPAIPAMQGMSRL